MRLFQLILEEFEKSYYTELLLWLAELAAVITAWRYARKERMGQLFFGYVLFNFIVLTIDILHAASGMQQHNLADRFTIRLNVILTVVDVYVYSNFFARLLHHRNVVRILRVCSACFIVGTTLLVFVYLHHIGEAANDLISKLCFISGFLILLLSCLAYFYELMIYPGPEALSARPSFWIATGLFFYACISLPYYLVINYLNTNNYLFINLLSALFFVVPFTANSIFLTKAFLCKKTLLT